MLDSRVYIQEEMDNFNTKGPLLDDSLKSLSRINKLLGNTTTTLSAVENILKEDSASVFHIIDLGCGGGDNLRAIAKWCIENNKRVKLTGIDANRHMLDYARRQPSPLHINYEYRTILPDEFEPDSCDILISSHFIYRFTDDDLIFFLKRMSKKVKIAIIFSELQRNSIPYIAFKVFAKLFSFNKIVVGDGLKAIKSSFKKKELQSILDQLDITSYDLTWKWAFRYLVMIRVS